MFPNVRLMVVAILAAIAGISCGLGLFATFRVNHEPLARLAEGSLPLQLAFDNRALGSDARAPLEARLPVAAAKVISVPVIVATASPAEQAGVDAALAADSGIQEAAAAAPDQSSTASLAAAVLSEQSSAPPEAIAATPIQQEAIAAVQDQQPPASAETTPTAEQTAAINATAVEQRPTAKAKKSVERKGTKPARASRAAAQPRRATKVVRARRTVATTAAQPAYQYLQPTYSQSAYSQPTSTWTDGAAQAAQPVRRVLTKRHRAAKKAVPTAQSSPSTATAGLSAQ
jgi:hypothetical protein